MNMTSAGNSVQKPGSKVHMDAVGAFLLKKEKCMEGGRMYFVRGGVCLFIGQVSKETERAGSAVPVKRTLGSLLYELFSGRWLASFVNCVRKQMCVDEIFVNDRNVRMVLVNSGLTSCGLFRGLDDYDKGLNVLRAG